MKSTLSAFDWRWFTTMSATDLQTSYNSKRLRVASWSRYLMILLFSVVLSVQSNAQLLPPFQPEQDACNAIVLCSNSFSSAASYTGIGLINDITSTPCNGFFSASGEANSIWLRVHVQTSGMVVFRIIPNVATDDYDFLVADVTNGACNNLSYFDIVRCNFNSNGPGTNPGGIVGVWYQGLPNFSVGGSAGTSFCAPIYAAAGTVFLVMVSNYGTYTSPIAPVSGFTIDFTGSTATFFDNSNPTISNVQYSCSTNQQVTLQTSEYIQCSTIAADGSDFIVSGVAVLTSAVAQTCNFNSANKIILDFATPLSPGTYTLTAQTGTDANTLLDLCGSPLLLPEQIQFTIPPPQLAFETIDTPACSEIRIRMTRRVRCDSLAIDGSDFLVTGPAPVNIVAAYGVSCDTMNLSDTVVLLLQSPPQMDGVYSITAKKGSDGNTLVDSCGNYQAVGDAIPLTINSYDGLIVSSPDSVLCESASVRLNADNYAKPPLIDVDCGIPSLVCAGIMSAAYIGKKDTATDVNTPFYGSWEDARAQYLYKASELRGMGLKAGMIQFLEWKVTEKNSTLPFDNFTIKIGCTSVNTLTGAFNASTQVVYSSAAYSTIPGWNKFDLSAPYNWDGVSNLIVEVCFDNAASSSSDKVAHSIAGASSVFRRFGNGLMGCTITNQGNAQFWSNIRPKVRFSVCEPPVDVLSYAWTPGTSLSDSTIQQPQTLIDARRTFHVTTVDRFGCLHKDSTVYTLSVRDPKLEPQERTICLGDSVQFEASGGLTYTWLAADPATLSCLPCPDPMSTPYTTSFYAVIISDAFCSDTLDATIVVEPTPNVTIIPGDTIVMYGTQLQLEGTGATSYSWSPAWIMNDPAIFNPIATIREPVVIILNGLYPNGCGGFDTITINVDYNDGVFIPSAFSPNGDGKNDVFRIGSVSFQKLLEFRIFNRWGQEVFSTYNLSQGWDGRFNGVEQPVGSYHYLIKIGWPGGKSETYKGNVTLVR
jgi:gliding motility-associated-like protein